MFTIQRFELNWFWEAWTGWSTSTFKNSCGCTARDMSEWREMSNDWADRLAGKATLTSGWLLGRSEVLRSLRHYLWAQSQGHHTIDRLEEKGMERGSARQSSLKGWERTIISQMNIGTVSKAMLGKLLRDGMEHIIMGFSERIDIILNWTELILPSHRNYVKGCCAFKGE